ncbi:MAG TPA: hypothetical protein VIB47_01855, partial [Dehalococcoidia bacterium]
MRNPARVTRRSFLDRVLVGTSIGASAAIFGAAFAVVDNDDANPSIEATQTQRAPGPTISGKVKEALPAALEPAAAGTTRQVTLDVVDTTLEIGGGVEYQAWTFGGRVPGPVVHVRQGDLVHATLNNKSTSGGHS